MFYISILPAGCIYKPSNIFAGGQTEATAVFLLQVRTPCLGKVDILALREAQREGEI